MVFFPVFTSLQGQMETCNSSKNLALDNVLPNHSCSPPQSRMFFSRLLGIYRKSASPRCCCFSDACTLDFVVSDWHWPSSSRRLDRLPRPVGSPSCCTQKKPSQVLWSEMKKSSSLLFCLYSGSQAGMSMSSKFLVKAWLSAPIHISLSVLLRYQKKGIDLGRDHMLSSSFHTPGTPSANDA